MKKHITLMLIFFFISCNNKNLSIEPIDKKFNFEGWQFQYYEISNYKNFSEEDLLNKLENFVKNKYPLQKYKNKNLIVFFYKKSIFENYKDDLNEIMDKDPDFGTIGKYRGNLIAKINYWKIDDYKKSYTRILFDNDDNQKMVRKDTLLIK
ncbi:hypothetical protein [Flavobacterium sp. ASV13]|uniref:hypothetical protein n=1 Tax=Flavobacterium sp. ASV13 TaxID=1506583 RepID=UPI00054E8C90|nr:hypothetical protein [Flavobacterium sp. ASV13]